MGATAVIGNFVGEENEKFGKVLSIMVFVYGCLITAGFAWATSRYSVKIAYAYTDDPDMITLLKNAISSLSLAILMTGPVLSLQGALKAL